MEEKDMRNIHKDILSGTFLLMFSIGVFINASGIPQLFSIDVGSGFAPKIASALLALVSLTIVRNGFHQQAALRQGQPQQKKEDINVIGVVGTIVAIAVYTFAMNYLGFIAATILYLAAQFSILAPLNKKTGPVIAILSLALPLLIYAVFEHGFSLILPTNAWM
ncbi:MAG: tripartite tricarboxylate transporter TctB family protein [Candidatus Accumulibacter sp.]|jgi:hypothetical protein|nr:tripartite tricarboxylate transporter TctB family protein [Accumulibacter sp.]